MFFFFSFFPHTQTYHLCADRPTVFVIGAFAKGKLDVDFVDTVRIPLSPSPPWSSCFLLFSRHRLLTIDEGLGYLAIFAKCCGLLLQGVLCVREDVESPLDCDVLLKSCQPLATKRR